jgi:hypothetical protein
MISPSWEAPSVAVQVPSPLLTIESEYREEINEARSLRLGRWGVRDSVPYRTPSMIENAEESIFVESKITWERGLASSPRDGVEEISHSNSIGDASSESVSYDLSDGVAIKLFIA